MNEPKQAVRDLMNKNHDVRGWKWPMWPEIFADKAAASEYADCLDFYLGGHEMSETGDGRWFVTSKGYYHYVGA